MIKPAVPDRVADPISTASNFNLPNFLTFLRILFVPVIARKYKLITNFGKIFDPIADKALIGVALIGLSTLGFLDWWITWVILFRELFVTFLRFWVINKGVIPASRGGKLKTIMQIVAISAYLLPLPTSFMILAEILMYIAVILTVLTAIDYILKAIMTDRN